MTRTSAGRAPPVGGWHQAHRIGGSHGIPASVYNRGHHSVSTGPTGSAPDLGSRLVADPGIVSGHAVDHIVELQLTPGSLLEFFDAVDNYESA